MAHKPRKRFGQNFLNDCSVVEQIIGYTQISPGQHWIEIGPGQGALTEPLLQNDIKLDLIELDRDLVTFLQHKFRDRENLKIHSCDALKFNFAELVKDSEQLHIIGNLPYNISTPLLFHLLESAKHIKEMYFMLQKEVVNRICAPPGNKQYGRLSIMIRYFCNTEYLFDVPPESFNPAPKVMSAIVKLIPHKTLPLIAVNPGDLNDIVCKAFSQRRKTLRNSLKNLVSAQQMRELSIDPALRAEALTLPEYVKLSNFYTQKKNSDVLPQSM